VPRAGIVALPDSETVGWHPFNFETGGECSMQEMSQAENQRSFNGRTECLTTFEMVSGRGRKSELTHNLAALTVEMVSQSPLVPVGSFWSWKVILPPRNMEFIIQMPIKVGVEPPLGDRIKHIACDSFSCSKREVSPILNFFSRAKVIFGQKATPR
jgi:hypothetical protein